MTNPILATWATPFDIAPFDSISDEDFAPALDEALAAHDAEIATIAANPEPPTFANTVEALEAAGGALDKVLSVFFTVAGADSNPKPNIQARCKLCPGGGTCSGPTSASNTTFWSHNCVDGRPRGVGGGRAVS